MKTFLKILPILILTCFFPARGEVANIERAGWRASFRK